ncbi:MAG TPA: hypothetical protein VJI69_10030 [Bacteroidia bacterium]|nr:hypothetical protein [Bacteroidia bacterium]
MKNLIIGFFLILIMLFCVETKALNDSLKRNTRFIIGLSGAPNNTYVIYSFGKSKNGSTDNYKDQKISFGAEGKLFIGLQKRKIQATLGLGYAYYLCKYADTYGANNDYTRDRYFQHKFYISSLNVNWLVGDENCWIVGLNAEYGVLHYFKKFVHIDNPIVVADYSIEYFTPQETIWAGINFGRLFKINKFIDFSIIFNTKASSIISGNRPKGSSYPNNIGTPDRNLFVKTLNLNFSLKL